MPPQGPSTIPELHICQHCLGSLGAMTQHIIGGHKDHAPTPSLLNLVHPVAIEELPWWLYTEEQENLHWRAKWLSMCMCICACVFMCMCICACMCMCMCACVHVCMCTCANVLLKCCLCAWCMILLHVLCLGMCIYTSCMCACAAVLLCLCMLHVHLYIQIICSIYTHVQSHIWKRHN